MPAVNSDRSEKSSVLTAPCQSEGMRVTRFLPTDAVEWPRHDSNTIAVVEDVATLDALLAAVDDLRAEAAPARLLVTLDDVAQCTYTSGHASEDERLDAQLEDLDWEDAAALARHDDATARFVAEQLDRPELAADWTRLADVRVSGPADVEALVRLNRDPDLALDDTCAVQRVPVGRDDLVIAGMPNGYFTCDWNTFQNHAIVRRMAGYGYRHVGIGAALLGFDRSSPLDEKQTDGVIADLVTLYGSGASVGWAELRSILLSSRVLLLGYTEDFAEITAP